VQEILRLQDLKTTLEVYAKAMSAGKLEAVEWLFNRHQKQESGVNCFEMWWPGAELNLDRDRWVRIPPALERLLRI
jgi:hypothetical protein